MPSFIIWWETLWGSGSFLHVFLISPGHHVCDVLWFHKNANDRMFFGDKPISNLQFKRIGSSPSRAQTSLSDKYLNTLVQNKYVLATSICTVLWASSLHKGIADYLPKESWGAVHGAEFLAGMCWANTKQASSSFWVFVVVSVITITIFQGEYFSTSTGTEMILYIAYCWFKHYRYYLQSLIVSWSGCLRFASPSFLWTVS